MTTANQPQSRFTVAPLFATGHNRIQFLVLKTCAGCGQRHKINQVHTCKTKRVGQDYQRQITTRVKSACHRPAQVSNHMGQLSQRITIKARIRHSTQRETRYGQAWWTLLIDADYNQYSYFGSVHLGERHEIVTITATVKAHTNWKGTNQTQISRPKHINP